jgi:hypothetical protein
MEAVPVAVAASGHVVEIEHAVDRRASQGPPAIATKAIDLLSLITGPNGADCCGSRPHYVDTILIDVLRRVLVAVVATVVFRVGVILIRSLSTGIGVNVKSQVRRRISPKRAVSTRTNSPRRRSGSFFAHTPLVQRRADIF